MRDPEPPDRCNPHVRTLEAAITVVSLKQQESRDAESSIRKSRDIAFFEQ